MPAPSPAAVRALYRAFLRWGATHPEAGGHELAAEASARFRAAAETAPSAEASTALFLEGEARLFDATFHGIPYARLEHATQHSVRALKEAAQLAAAPVGRDAAAAADSAAKGAADPGVRSALAAAAARLRLRAAADAAQK